MNLTRREITIFGIVVLAVLFGGLLLLIWLGSIRGIGFGGTGPGMMGPRMMGGFNTFGWLLPCLIPLSLLVLLIGGLLIWASGPGPGTQQNSHSADAHCPNCQRPVQADWQVCPHCGTSLREEKSE